MRAGLTQIEYSICLKICRLMWTQYSGSAPLSGVHLHCTPLCDVAPSSIVEWYQRCTDSRIFSTHSSSCVYDHVPIAKNVKFAFAQKNFQTCIPSMPESVSALLSDGYITNQRLNLSEVTMTAIHCVQLKISWQLTVKENC